MNVSLDHIQLAIPSGSETTARAFWCDRIGLKEIRKPAALQGNGGCWFKLGALELHLGIQEPFVPATKAHPGFLCEDIDALAKRIETVKWDTTLADRKRFFTTDPFGNRLEFIQKT